jgi:hypothetical protein
LTVVILLQMVTGCLEIQKGRWRWIGPKGLDFMFEWGRLGCITGETTGACIIIDCLMDWKQDALKYRHLYAIFNKKMRINTKKKKKTTWILVPSSFLSSSVWTRSSWYSSKAIWCVSLSRKFVM